MADKYAAPGPSSPCAGDPPGAGRRLWRARSGRPHSAPCWRADGVGREARARRQPGSRVIVTGKLRRPARTMPSTTLTQPRPSIFRTPGRRKRGGVFGITPRPLTDAKPVLNHDDLSGRRLPRRRRSDADTTSPDAKAELSGHILHGAERGNVPRLLGGRRH